MRKDGTAEYVGGGKEGDVVWLYWRKPEEWAGLVEAYVEETGQKGSVLTVYELVEGDGTIGNGKLLNKIKGQALTGDRYSRHGYRSPTESSEHPR